MTTYYFPKTYIEATDRLMQQYEKFISTGLGSSFSQNFSGGPSCPLCAVAGDVCRRCPNVVMAGKRCEDQRSFRGDFWAKDSTEQAKRRLSVWRRRRAKMRVWENPPRDWWKNSKRKEAK